MSVAKSYISADNLHVIYKRGSLVRKTREYHVIKGISFEINKGDSLAIIGSNGAGKSTLLRVIAGIIEPDEGSLINNDVTVKLLALGAGIAPDCSGRDNIVIQAMLQGNCINTADKMNDLISKVVEFAELENYIHEPFKTYSDGMKARLNFAVATQIQSDVLLVDEVMAVGDIKFREKTSQFMIDKFKSGDTVVLVSHNLEIIKSLCNRAMWIEQGKLLLDGPTEKVVDAYEQYYSKSNEA